VIKLPAHLAMYVGTLPLRRKTMKKLLLLAGIFLALITTVASNNKALAHVIGGVARRRSSLATEQPIRRHGVFCAVPFF
jgi:hypothetical protein